MRLSIPTVARIGQWLRGTEKWTDGAGRDVCDLPRGSSHLMYVCGIAEVVIAARLQYTRDEGTETR